MRGMLARGGVAVGRASQVVKMLNRTELDDMELTNTSSHMVQEVTNIIDGYKMGSMRALAQEPVQNALDAVRKGRKKVEVEYRLLCRTLSSGETCYLLTVTDRGTTGLRGPMVTAQELEGRNFQLKPEENWAAFEAQGYTKENEDALGSRGQGKSAFLYHSHVPPCEPRRMLILYDTLLEDGEYRLGMRFARPVDQVLSPPLVNAEAQAALQRDVFPAGDLNVPLRLTPLREVGTRVIVPYLADEDVKEVRSGDELARWLQRCWWRAIQRGELHIRVVDDESGVEETIVPPSWWQNLPSDNEPSAKGRWLDLPDGARACIWGDLAFGDGHKIRRLVMLHSDSIDEDEIVKDHPEYAGIQVLRGSQWIETRGARQDYGDYIPPDKRPGFRGYVEFGKGTESMLRAAENSQHDGFDARGNKGEVVRSLRELLNDMVKEFSAEMGWEIPQAVSQQQVSQREQQTHSRFLETFLNPNGHKAKSSKHGVEREGENLLWDCRLSLDYPDSKSARVDWGQSISRVYVEVAVEPSEAMNGSADVVLEWLDSAGKPKELVRNEEAIRKQWGEDRVEEQFELGDWKIHRGEPKQSQQVIYNPDPGECRLRAVVVYRGQRVKSAARTVYVQTDPPPPPEKNPVTLSISAVNTSVNDKKRFDHGEELQLQITARNRGTQPGSFLLTATFDDDLLVRDEPIELEGTPAGDSPRRNTILIQKIQLLDPHQPAPTEIDGSQPKVMPHSSGRYTLSADLFDEDGDVVAHASKSVFFQRDPDRTKNDLPFDIRQESELKQMWKLNNELTELIYSDKHPVYIGMKDVLQQRRALQGRLAFIAEISANGLLEWAMRPKLQDGNDNNFDQLYDEQHNTEDGLWEKLNRCLENLSKAEESPIEFDQIRRVTVAVMLEIFAKEHN